MFFKKIYLTSFAVVLFSANFVESSSAVAAHNLRNTVNDEETKADTIENLQPEDEVFWKRTLSVSTDLAFFESNPVQAVFV